MATDLSEIQSKWSSMQHRIQRTLTEANLNEVARDITDTSNDAMKLPDELARLRSRGYVFAAYLEQKVNVLATRWDTVRREAQHALDGEVYRLRLDLQQVEALVAKANAGANNPKALMIAVPPLERELNDLERKVKEAERRVKNCYSMVERDIDQTVEQISDLHWALDQRDDATFPFLAGENLFLAAKGEWVATGNGRKDPDGILYLTDQRLIFEQKETTGKTLGLFGGKKEQELEWEVPLHLVESVKAENKGLFGGKDMLIFALKSGARYPSITVEVKGKARSKFWAGQIERMIRGGTDDERAITPDPEVVEALRSAPTACDICGATLPQLVANQRQVDCEYCGRVMRV